MFAASITMEEIRLMALGARAEYALAMRTLGANLAMAGLCAEIAGAWCCRECMLAAFGERGLLGGWEPDREEERHA